MPKRPWHSFIKSAGIILPSVHVSRILLPSLHHFNILSSFEIIAETLLVALEVSLSRCM